MAIMASNVDNMGVSGNSNKMWKSGEDGKSI
jgi:hypothetical protein